MHTANKERGLAALRDDRSRSGAILGLVLVAMVVVSLLGMGMMRMTALTGVEAGRTVASSQSFWTAEAGLERVKAIAQKRRRPLSLINVNGTYLTGSNVLTGTTSKGSYTVDVVTAPGWTNGLTAIQKYLITSRATTPAGKTYTVSVEATIESFASYMHATQHETSFGGGLIVFNTGDVIDGPVYVNDRLTVYGTPIFRQHVSSASNNVNFMNGGTADSFQGGLTLNATPLDFGSTYSSDHIQNLKAEADEPNGLSLSGAQAGDYKIKFNSDGSFTYQRTTGGAVTTNYVSALNGAIYVQGDAWVEGVLNGKVTVAAQDTIYITNSIVYASAVSPNPWQTNTFNPALVTDALGLMASNQVQILGHQAINIHAAIMVTADGGGFNASNKYVNVGWPNINLYGSLAQYRRGVVGQVNGNGFLKNYKYDTRFYADAPPNFPYSVYTFTSWKQSGN